MSEEIKLDEDKLDEYRMLMLKALGNTTPQYQQMVVGSIPKEYRSALMEGMKDVTEIFNRLELDQLDHLKEVAKKRSYIKLYEEN